MLYKMEKAKIKFETALVRQGILKTACRILDSFVSHFGDPVVRHIVLTYWKYLRVEVGLAAGPNLSKSIQ